MKTIYLLCPLLIPIGTLCWVLYAILTSKEEHEDDTTEDPKEPYF